MNLAVGDVPVVHCHRVDRRQGSTRTAEILSLKSWNSGSDDIKEVSVWHRDFLSFGYLKFRFCNP